jgi:hypothetical protein
MYIKGKKIEVVKQGAFPRALARGQRYKKHPPGFNPVSYSPGLKPQQIIGKSSTS